MKDLNSVASEYKPNGVIEIEIENDLMLHWYPKRVTSRCGNVESLLELGIGHGFTANIFASSCQSHVILDGASDVITQFHQTHPHFKGSVVEDYFENYTPNQQFDVIVMGFVLEHVDNPELILKRYKQFLKPKGKLYVAVPNAKSLNRRLGLELGVIDDIYSLNKNDLKLGHQRQYCLDTLRESLSKTGYQITHEEGIYLKPLPLSILQTVPDFKANLQAMLHVGVDFPELCVALLCEAELA